MKTNELMNSIANKTNMAKSDVEALLKAQAEVVHQALSNGDDVTLPGLVKLETKDRAARVGRNPQTGEAVNIPAKTVPTAKPVKAMKDAVA